MQEDNKGQTFRTVGAGILAVVAIGAFISWRNSVPALRPGHVAMLVDPSDSRQRVCGQVGEIAQRQMNDSAMGRGSTITLFSTGGPESANEPVQRGTFTLPDTRATMGGPGAITAKQQQLVESITARCMEIPETTASPVFQGVKRVIEFLQEQDHRPNAHLAIYALTDGEETEVKEIKAAFDQPPGSVAAIPQINNERVEVQICGVAETIGTVATPGGKRETKTRTRDPQRADREREVWKQAFSQPGTVSINPYCVSSLSQAQTQSPDTKPTSKE